jgi:hypothetical protein
MWLRLTLKDSSSVLGKFVSLQSISSLFGQFQANIFLESKLGHSNLTLKKPCSIILLTRLFHAFGTMCHEPMPRSMTDQKGTRTCREASSSSCNDVNRPVRDGPPRTTRVKGLDNPTPVVKGPAGSRSLLKS